MAGIVQSMTAYGRSSIQGEWGVLTCELKSINHRYCDLTLKLPSQFRSLDAQLRAFCQQKLARGKIELFIKFEPSELYTAQNTQIVLNKALAEQYLTILNQLDGLIGDKSHGLDPVALLAQPQIVISRTLEQDNAELEAHFWDVVQQSVEQLCLARQTEGERLKVFITEKLAKLQEIIEQVVDLMPKILEAQRNKLLEQINDLAIDTVNHERLEQELVFFAQKIDVKEELDRLQAHIEQVTSVLANGGVLGRRLDFLMQELNREANTLGSKSAGILSSRSAIDLKVLIEQMREQVQNIE